jgi:cytidylate kinase
MKIAITGLSASGKGTVSRGVAKAAKLYYLDAGLVFRSVAWVMLLFRAETQKEFRGLIQRHNLRFDWNGNDFNVFFGNKAIGDSLHEPMVCRKTAELASDPSWLEEMKSLTKRVMKRRSRIVVDGRNAGGSILFDADFIFYIDVSAETRALRRYTQLLNPSVSYEEILSDLRARDEKDLNRKHDPFVVPERAIIVSNEKGDVSKCVEKIMSIISA